MATADGVLMMAAEDLRLANNCIWYYKQNYGKQGYIQAKNYAAFHLQQAVEKVIKFQILVVNNSLQNERWYRTHNLVTLINKSAMHKVYISVPKELKPYLKKLTDWVGGVRYGDIKGVRISTVEKIYNLIVIWYNSFNK